MTDPPRSGGEPGDPLLRAIARHWTEIRSLASDEQWERVRAIIAGTYDPDPREAFAALADVLWEILPPAHEICEIMRTTPMVATVPLDQSDAEMLERLWLLSELVQPGEAAWRGHHPELDDHAGDDVAPPPDPEVHDFGLLVETRLLSLPSLTPDDARQRGIDPHDIRLIRLPRPGAAVAFQLPAFQFVPAGGPWDIVVEVNEVLDAADDPWGVMCWWVDPHARLGDAPADLLGRGQDGLIRRAAHAMAEDY